MPGYGTLLPYLHTYCNKAIGNTALSHYYNKGPSTPAAAFIKEAHSWVMSLKLRQPSRPPPVVIMLSRMYA